MSRSSTATRAASKRENTPRIWPSAEIALCRRSARRAGAGQAAGGAALATAGNIARFMPVPGLGAAQGLRAGGSAAEAVGPAAAGQGAMTAEQAMQDYVLVVNACRERRGYVLLR